MAIPQGVIQSTEAQIRINVINGCNAQPSVVDAAMNKIGHPVRIDLTDPNNPRAIYEGSDFQRSTGRGLSYGSNDLNAAIGNQAKPRYYNDPQQCAHDQNMGYQAKFARAEISIALDERNKTVAAQAAVLARAQAIVAAQEAAKAKTDAEPAARAEAKAERHVAQAASPPTSHANGSTAAGAPAASSANAAQLQCPLPREIQIVTNNYENPRTHEKFTIGFTASYRSAQVRFLNGESFGAGGKDTAEILPPPSNVSPEEASRDLGCLGLGIDAMADGNTHRGYSTPHGGLQNDRRSISDVVTDKVRRVIVDKINEQRAAINPAQTAPSNSTAPSATPSSAPAPKGRDRTSALASRFEITYPTLKLS